MLSNIEGLPIPEETSFITFRIHPDLSIVGDMYSTHGPEIQEPAYERTIPHGLESGPLDNESEPESEDEWVPNQSNWRLDFSQIAKAVCPIVKEPIAPTRHKLREIKEKMIESAEKVNFPPRTLYTL
jgi:hypothetical protein